MTAVFLASIYRLRELFVPQVRIYELCRLHRTREAGDMWAPIPGDPRQFVVLPPKRASDQTGEAVER